MYKLGEYLPVFSTNWVVGVPSAGAYVCGGVDVRVGVCGKLDFLFVDSSCLVAVLPSTVLVGVFVGMFALCDVLETSRDDVSGCGVPDVY